MGIEVIFSKKEWDNLLLTIDNYDFYHTYDYHWLSKSSDETPVLLKYEELNVLILLPLFIRNIAGTIYKDATSAYGYVGPVFKGNLDNFNNHEFKNKLIEYFNENNIISVFSRLNPFIQDQYRILSNIGNITNHGTVVNIDIEKDLELQRQKYQSRLKTHINKSRRSCSIKVASTEEDLQEFKSIYFENMDRVHAKKTYYFSDSYFKKLFTSQDFKSEILLAIDNASGKTIAGSQFISTKNIVQYHLSGTRNDYLHLMPTKLLIDEMRIISSKRGLKFFNLGGGLGGTNEDSLFNFKSSFSKDFKNFNLWKLIVNHKIYDDLVSKKCVTKTSNYFPLYRYIDDLNINL